MYKGTIIATYIGNLVGALVVNLSPLLFVTFMDSYGLSFEEVGALVLINFVTQIASDIIHSHLVDRYGVRPFITAGHALVVAGFLLLSASPFLMPAQPYPLMIAATVIFSYGGGILELLLSAIIAAIPSDEKAKAMSLLHSFYAWGFIFMVLVTTGLLELFTRERWYLLPLFWSLVPLGNFFLFMRVPLAPMATHHARVRFRTLFKSPYFILMMLTITIGGAAEVTMSQWASTFAETSLGLPKEVGDLGGVVMFALFLGIGRHLYGIYGKEHQIWYVMFFGSILTLASYLIVSLSPYPLIALVACMVSGLGVSLLWPGSIVLSQRAFPHASAGMFALLAAAGDTGAGVGPFIIGAVSGANIEMGAGAALKSGFLVGTLYPLLLIIILLVIRYHYRHYTAISGGGESSSGVSVEQSS